MANETGKAPNAGETIAPINQTVNNISGGTTNVSNNNLVSITGGTTNISGGTIQQITNISGGTNTVTGGTTNITGSVTVSGGTNTINEYTTINGGAVTITGGTTNVYNPTTVVGGTGSTTVINGGDNIINNYGTVNVSEGSSDKVKTSGIDPTAGYLFSKLHAGANIDLTESIFGGTYKVDIRGLGKLKTDDTDSVYDYLGNKVSATGLNLSVVDAGGGNHVLEIENEQKLKATNDDSVPGFLIDKIEEGLDIIITDNDEGGLGHVLNLDTRGLVSADDTESQGGKKSLIDKLVSNDSSVTITLDTTDPDDHKVDLSASGGGGGGGKGWINEYTSLLQSLTGIDSPSMGVDWDDFLYFVEATGGVYAQRWRDLNANASFAIGSPGGVVELDGYLFGATLISAASVAQTPDSMGMYWKGVCSNSMAHTGSRSFCGIGTYSAGLLSNGIVAGFIQATKGGSNTNFCCVVYDSAGSQMIDSGVAFDGNEHEHMAYLNIADGKVHYFLDGTEVGTAVTPGGTGPFDGACYAFVEAPQDAGNKTKVNRFLYVWGDA